MALACHFVNQVGQALRLATPVELLDLGRGRFRAALVLAVFLHPKFIPQAAGDRVYVGRFHHAAASCGPDHFGNLRPLNAGQNPPSRAKVVVQLGGNRHTAVAAVEIVTVLQQQQQIRLTTQLCRRTAGNPRHDA